MIRVVVRKPLPQSEQRTKGKENFSSWLRKVPSEFLKDVYRHYRVRRDIPLQPFIVEPANEEVTNGIVKNDLPQTPAQKNLPIILHKSVFFLLMTLLGLELFFDLIYFGLRVLFMYVTIPTSFFSQTNLTMLFFIVFVVLNITKLIFMAIACMQWITFTYEITEREVRYKYGILNRNEKIFLLAYTQEVMYTQSIMGKLCNFGTIAIYNPTIKETVYLDSIPNPKKYTEIVKSYLPSSNDSTYIPIKIHQ